MTPPIRDSYLTASIESNARVFAHLLQELPADSPHWDAKPDAERFSLREVVAHLVDYDVISRERFEHMIREDKPDLPDWNLSEAAQHYANRDPKHQLENFLVSRLELSKWLRGLSEAEWKRSGTRPGVGEFSVEEGATLMIAHDCYHLEQVAAWLDATK